MAKILVGLVGGFCFLAFFTYWLPIEEEAWGRVQEQGSCPLLQRGEDAVLEHLKGEGWTNLKVLANEILGISSEEEESDLGFGFTGGIVRVIGTKEKENAGFYVVYGVRETDCEVLEVMVYKKVSIDW